MITRLQATLIALGFIGLFVVSLSLDLHGAVAVFAALGFAIFLSAIIGRNLPVLRILKMIFGALVAVIQVLNLLKFPDQNAVFVSTILVFGLLMAFDPIVLWIIRDERAADSKTENAKAEQGEDAKASPRIS